MGKQIREVLNSLPSENTNGLFFWVSKKQYRQTTKEGEGKGVPYHVLQMKKVENKD